MLRQATDQDLIAAQNPAYMRLYTENISYAGQLKALEYVHCLIHSVSCHSCSHRKAYATLASAPVTSHHAIEKEIQDTTPEKQEDYPEILFWRKRDQLDERRRRDEFAKAGLEPRRRGRKPKVNSETENVSFWFLQYADGTVLTGDEEKKIRADSKKSWRTICDKYGPIGSPWTSISPKHQLEFYIDIEAKHPNLRLCEDHYKAESIAFSDYSHWYNVQYPPVEDNPDPVPIKPRKRSRTASPVKARNTRKVRRQTKSRRAPRKQVLESDKEESVDEFDDDANDDDDENKNANSEADVDADGDDDDDRLTRQLPFSPVRRSPRRPARVPTSSSSSKQTFNTARSSVNSPSKPKPKPRPLRTAAANSKTLTPRENEDSAESGSHADRPSPHANRPHSARTGDSGNEAPAVSNAVSTQTTHLTTSSLYCSSTQIRCKFPQR